MFISQLKDKMHTYDPYSIYLINGLKVLYISELLFTFHLIYTVPNNPYFYFFYVSFVAFAAETVGTTLKEKFLFLSCTMLGSAISIFLFGVCSEYHSFFALVVFFYALLLYYVVIHKLKRMLPLVPLMLSLAVYSLIYKNSDANFYIALNHFAQIIVAMIIILIGLYFFPKKYYLLIWYKALSDVLSKLEHLTKAICEDQIIKIPIFSGVMMMDRYSKMLSRKMKYYSILKITLLVFELIMTLSFYVSFKNREKIQYTRVLNQYLALMDKACQNKIPVDIPNNHQKIFAQTHALRTLHQLILSWNYLCTDL